MVVAGVTNLTRHAHARDLGQEAASREMDVRTVPTRPTPRRAGWRCRLDFLSCRRTQGSSMFQAGEDRGRAFRRNS